MYDEKCNNIVFFLYMILDYNFSRPYVWQRANGVADIAQIRKQYELDYKAVGMYYFK